MTGKRGATHIGAMYSWGGPGGTCPTPWNLQSKSTLRRRELKQQELERLELERKALEAASMPKVQPVDLRDLNIDDLRDWIRAQLAPNVRMGVVTEETVEKIASTWTGTGQQLLDATRDELTTHCGEAGFEFGCTVLRIGLHMTTGGAGNGSGSTPDETKTKTSAWWAAAAHIQASTESGVGNVLVSSTSSLWARVGYFVLIFALTGLRFLCWYHSGAIKNWVSDAVACLRATAKSTWKSLVIWKDGFVSWVVGFYFSFVTGAIALGIWIQKATTDIRTNAKRFWNGVVRKSKFWVRQPVIDSGSGSPIELPQVTNAHVPSL